MSTRRSHAFDQACGAAGVTMRDVLIGRCQSIYASTRADLERGI